jgi:hypothetical protein
MPRLVVIGVAVTVTLWVLAAFFWLVGGGPGWPFGRPGHPFLF